MPDNNTIWDNPNGEIFSAFSGANIYATIGPYKIGQLQMISYSISREVAALYGLGDADPRCFVKGKRGITGSLIFTQFDRDAAVSIFSAVYNKKLGNNAAASMFNTRFGGDLTGQSVLSNKPLTTRNFVDKGSGNGGLIFPDVDSTLQGEISAVYQAVADRYLKYADQVPPFDVTLTMANENGDASTKTFGGIIMVNESGQYSLDTMVQEVAHTFVCRHITPLTPIGANRNHNYNRNFVKGGSPLPQNFG